jgi:ferredoxin-NADP reductase
MRCHPARCCTPAASPQEFALLPRLLQWQQEARCLDLQLHTTRQHAPLPAQLQAHVVRRHRIGAKDLQAAVAALQAGGSSPGPVAYVCGPPGMTDDVVQQLVESGVAPGDIKTERWW